MPSFIQNKGNFINKQTVCGKPVHLFQLLCTEPPRRLMFLQDNMISGEFAPEAIHRQMKGWVIVFKRPDKVAYMNLCVQFFENLPGERFLRRLARFHLAAGK